MVPTYEIYTYIASNVTDPEILLCFLGSFGSSLTQAVNLEQRPGSHPIAHWLLPTLLRGSSMWFMQRKAPLSGEARLHVKSVSG